MLSIFLNNMIHSFASCVKTDRLILSDFAFFMLLLPFFLCLILCYFGWNLLFLPKNRPFGAGSPLFRHSAGTRVCTNEPALSRCFELLPTPRAVSAHVLS